MNVCLIFGFCVRILKDLCAIEFFDNFDFFRMSGVSKVITPVLQRQIRSVGLAISSNELQGLSQKKNQFILVF